MKIHWPLALFLVCTASSAESDNFYNSLTFINNQQNVAQIWINSISYQISTDSVLRVPCDQTDVFDLQTGYEIERVKCGTIKEIN
jgi:hypothetical protein